MRTPNLLFALSFLTVGLGPFQSAQAQTGPSSAIERSRQREELSALWSYYKYAYIKEGRVVSLDEGQITTSEGQGYALLRAVWSDDRLTFEEVWSWTRGHLQVRGDHLFSWRWKGMVLDHNSATDADTDIALALLLAARHFGRDDLRAEALAILDDIWRLEVVESRGAAYATGGSSAPRQAFPKIHVGYLAPYAYEIFAREDARHPWRKLVKSSYRILHWIYFERRLPVPPEAVYLDKRRGVLRIEDPKTGVGHGFGYDAVPVFWRVALDEAWFGRGEDELRAKMLEYFAQRWKSDQAIFERYSLRGEPLSKLEGWPHLATLHALARLDEPDLARSMEQIRLLGLWQNALAGVETPYYLHNWLWFDRAFDQGAARHYGEPLGFLRPIDLEGFYDRFPWVLSALALALFPFARRSRTARAAFLVAAFALCARYLAWRATATLNFKEALGPLISLALLAAEVYGFGSVVLLLVQVGLGGPKQTLAPKPLARLPSVDIFIPIYSESLDILDKTLSAASAIRYANKTLYVCDDSHREEVRALALEHGARYLRGPRKHAKAGNLNNALGQSSGELIVVFDTDHIPLETFLEKTVPHFADPRVGFVQTPHHFYNQDIFQRAFGAGERIPDEQDLFNHGIQGARDAWGGAFFVGSGAVFRRTAMEGIGGFNLLSITEDIHTSQHLHAAGWKSTFVDEDLAVGLTAENLSGYLVQRRRWMLGCLQIFFKDNPLFTRGLPLRHRLGYFSSLYYFFFPAARVVFWTTPLWFLLFHLHPLFADVSVLLAYLLPYMVILPTIGMALLPRWPRMFWSMVYEFSVSFQLLRSMFDLLLPSSLGFKVTPKGITSERRAFDLCSSRLILAAFGVNLFAVGKGMFELLYFGIEKDAYFFNLGWAILNLVLLGLALLVAWERPQRRAEERVARAMAVRLDGGRILLETRTREMSLTGFSVLLAASQHVPERLRVTLGERPALAFEARQVWSENVAGRRRAGFAFLEVTPEQRRELVRVLFASAGVWTQAHDRHARTSFGMILALVGGIVRALLPSRIRRRRSPRALRPRLVFLRVEGRRQVALQRDRSQGGVGLFLIGRPLSMGHVPLSLPPLWGRSRAARIAYQRRVLPGVWRVGLHAPESFAESALRELAA
jgi:cellulose synthase (UDP-forming)